MNVNAHTHTNTQPSGQDMWLHLCLLYTDWFPIGLYVEGATEIVLYLYLNADSWLCFHDDTSLVTVTKLLVSAHHNNITYVITGNSHIHRIRHSKLVTLLNVNQYKYLHNFSVKQTLHTHSRIHRLALTVCTRHLVTVCELNKQSAEFRLTRYISLSHVQSTPHHHNTDTQRYWILDTSLIDTRNGRLGAEWRGGS